MDDERAYLTSAVDALEEQPEPKRIEPATASGFAVKTAAGIDVRSICPTEVGAAANWLVTECGLMATNGTPDDAILRTFRVAASVRGGAEIIRISIKELLQ